MSIRKEDALAYHADGKPGKIEIVSTKPVSTIRDLSLAYSPGVAYPCLEIAEDVDKVYDYTARGNVVAVISNGTAVLGLGDIGPEASKPVMEGKAILFKRYADIDGVDIEINVTDPDEFVRVVRALEPSFGGINLEDIKAPECFEIEQRLREELSIPIMHDDQHGTAIISAAALLNACELTGRKLSDAKIVMNGAGAAAISCARLYVALGARKENMVMCDRKGAILASRADLDASKAEFASSRTGISTLADALAGADVFIGLSSANVVSEDMLKAMAAKPIVFALANPDPEIAPEKAKASRPEVIMATGRSDYPNQVNNVLGFPYIFRGALDVRATKINETMKHAAVHAIANLAKEQVPDVINQLYGTKLHFGPEYLIPKPMDPRLITAVSMAVAKAAMDSGVAKRPIADWDAYRQQLEARLGLNQGLTRVILQRAQTNPKKVAFPEAYHPKILKAAQILADEKIAQPVLLGNRERILAALTEYDIDLPNLEIIDPELEPAKRETYARRYFERRQRKGATYQEALKLMDDRDHFALMMLDYGATDAVITGLTTNYAQCLRPAFEIIGLEADAKAAAGLYILNTRKGVYFFADTTVNLNPDEDTLVEVGALAARAVAFFKLDPRVAMLSYANYGSNREPQARKMGNAARKLRQRMPDLIVDGEIQANLALRPDMLREFFPFSNLLKNGEGANTFIFPDLASANISYKLLQELGDAEAIGPVLLGLNKPVHILQMGCSVREIVNMAAIAVIDAQDANRFF